MPLATSGEIRKASAWLSLVRSTRIASIEASLFGGQPHVSSFTLTAHRHYGEEAREKERLQTLGSGAQERKAK